jgi:cytochrome P450
VFVNLHSIHHNPDIWGPDHAAYDPDRWYDGRADETVKELVIPFMVGKRTCTGQYLAKANILKMLTTLLKAYEFNLVNAEEPVVVTTHGATILRTPLLVKCKER